MLGEETSPEFEASPHAEEAGVDLESARQAYQVALETLQKMFPDVRDDVRKTTELTRRNPLGMLIQLPLTLITTILSVPYFLLKELWDIFVETFADLRTLLGSKNARLHEIRKSERAADLQRHLLEVLWARDFVQYVLEQPEPVPYHIKRDTLQFLISNDDLLDRLRRKALDEAEIDPVQLRKAQPTPPRINAWWWFTDNRRIRRARRINAFWFALSVIPALAAIVLITLLTQRLSIDGPDVLSGASALAQLVLGAGSILAGRELINMFLSDRSSGRSWQGEATFVLATLFLVVVASFYIFAPPAAAGVYNWFGQRAIEAGNAAEAELYLESAARLDPDPHAGNLQEVGCLYLTFGSRDRAQSVFERVLEADSRLLLSRYHLAEIYIAQGDFDTARELLNDGINLLNSARNRLGSDNADELVPYITSEQNADKIDYLLRLALGHVQLESGENQSARQALGEAEQLYTELEATDMFNLVSSNGVIELPCQYEGDTLDSYIEITKLDLTYYQARTLDEICQTDLDDAEARSLWTTVVRSKPTGPRQESYVAQALVRLQNYESCRDLSES